MSSFFGRSMRVTGRRRQVASRSTRHATITPHSGRLGVLALLVAAASLCGYLALILLGSPPQASAASSAPGFLGEVVEGEVPGGVYSTGLAVDPENSDAYLSESNRVVKLSPYGVFLLSFGKEVDLTKVKIRQEEEAKSEPVMVTTAEEDICTAASGDDCSGDNGYGSEASQFRTASGVAVEPATGDVYVQDQGNHRVQKFDSSGHFLLMFGKEVNKTKVAERQHEEAESEPVTVTAAEEDLCTAASGNECQTGKTGGAQGAFEEWPYGAKVLAVGGPSESVYVGDKGRVEVFSGNGTFKESVSLSAVSATAKVIALAADTSGDVFFVDQGIAGVHEVEPGGAVSPTVIDSASTGVEALTTSAAGALYVADRSPSFRLLGYAIANPAAPPVEFGNTEPGKLGGAHGVAIDAAGTIEVAASNQKLYLYGSLAAMESEYGAPPVLAPVISSEAVKSEAAETSATLEAQINPQLREVTYQFEYGTEPCDLGGCTKAPASPAALGSVTKTLHLVSVALSELRAGPVYHYRLVASNAAGRTEGPERLFSIDAGVLAGPPGLPDGRVWEQVSPTSKNGNFFDAPSEIIFALASADGNAIVYPMSGPAGEASSGLITEYVSKRKPGQAWPTIAATSRPTGGREATVANGPPLTIVPSADFSSVLFTSRAPYVSEDPGSGVNIFISHDPFVEPEWLGRPQAEFVRPALGAVSETGYTVAGASPDLRTAYYAYSGTLTPEDSAREAYVEEGNNPRRDAPWGFYEWHEGALVSAGELPDGTFDPFGAVPAAVAGDTTFFRKFLGDEAINHDNEVSEDGSTAFFVSPDPAASVVTDASECAAKPPCSPQAPQLYVRKLGPEDHKVSVLVSASHMPGHEGEPSQHGVSIIPDASGGAGGTTAFASSDGTHVLFASEDPLTEAAPENGEVKTYEYDVTTGSLTYLPGVTGPIDQVSHDGSQALFVNTEATPSLLELWQAGPEGGTVSAIAQPKSGALTVGTARISAEGASVVFATAATLAGGFNDSGGYSQVYRYEVEGAELSCVSCPPHGVAPSGNAEITHDNKGGANGRPQSTLEPRSISSDGSRIFFDTPAALVPKDTNGVRDVYEWEKGKVYLISSGTGTEEALYLDNDVTGENVFFATSAGLVTGDTDEAYDVYDARIPRPGDNPPPAQVPCKGSVCQGPPSVPQLLNPPASEAFEGPGDLTPRSPSHTKRGRKLTQRQKLKRALKVCRGADRHRLRKRRECERKARRQRQVKASRARHVDSTRSHNRRGK